MKHQPRPPATRKDPIKEALDVGSLEQSLLGRGAAQRGGVAADATSPQSAHSLPSPGGRCDPTTSSSRKEPLRSADVLEGMYSRALLRHASRCVGVDFDTDVKGVHVARTYESLASMDEGIMYSVLQPYHKDERLLRKFVELFQGEGGTSSSGQREDGAEEEDRVLWRLARIYNVINDGKDVDQDESMQKKKAVRGVAATNTYTPSIAAEAIRLAEIALKKHNAAQREREAMLNRVMHACAQLEAQDTRYSVTRKNLELLHHEQKQEGPGTGSDEAAGGRRRSEERVGRSVTRPSSAPHHSVAARAAVTADDSGCCSQSGVSAANTHTARVLLHLRKFAAAERDRIAHEVHIRQQEQEHFYAEGAVLREVSKCLRGEGGAAPTMIPAKRPTESVEAQSEFHASLLQFREREAKLREERQRERFARNLREGNISAALNKAERRRFEFLRNREVGIRAREERLREQREAAEQQKANQEQQAEAAKQERNERLNDAHTQQQIVVHSATRERSLSARSHRKTVQERADQLSREREERARQRTVEFEEKLTALERENAKKRAAASTKHNELEERRRQALTKARELEEKKKRDTEELRLQLDESQERRAQRAAYLAMLRDDEAKIKEETRRKLVEQYARAREYREMAFREQWERGLSERKASEKEQKAGMSAAHALHIRQDVKLRQILREQNFTVKDLERLDGFLAEIDELVSWDDTAAPPPPVVQ